MKMPGKYYFLLLVLVCGLLFAISRCSQQEDSTNNGVKHRELTDTKPEPEDLSKDKIENEAVSSGERVLVHPIPWLNHDGEKQKKCKDNWQQKTDLLFSEFSINCPIDVEAKIYANNAIARTNAEAFGVNNNIIAKVAVVVPISSGKNKLDVDPSIKHNGIRIFNSIEILKGIELAQREFLNGLDVGDRKIFLEVQILDDSYKDTINENKKAERSANYLTDQNDVISVIGHFSSDSIQAAARYYDNKLVAFSPTSTAIRANNSSPKDEEEFQLNSYIFRTAPNDKFAIETLMEVIKGINSDLEQKPLKTAIILYEKSSIFSLKYKQEFEKKFLEQIEGGQLIPTNGKNNCKFYNNVAINAKEYCKNFIRNNNPDILLLVPSSDRALEIARPVLDGIKELESKPQLLGADTMFNQVFADTGIAEGMIVAVPTKSLPIKGVDLSWRGVMSYDAAQAIYQAISKSKCDFDSPQQEADIYQCLRKQIQEVLSGEDFKAPGILGAESVFFENGDRQIDEGMAQELEEPQQVQKTGDDKYEFKLYINN